MTTAAWVTAVAATVMFGYGPVFCGVVKLRTWLHNRTNQQQPQPEPVLPNPMLTHPSLRSHQAVARTWDLIAADEAARLDDEWATVAKEWTRG
jgi:hypothetical protein